MARDAERECTLRLRIHGQSLHAGEGLERFVRIHVDPEPPELVARRRSIGRMEQAIDLLLDFLVRDAEARAFVRGLEGLVAAQLRGQARFPAEAPAELARELEQRRNVLLP